MVERDDAVCGGERVQVAVAALNGRSIGHKLVFRVAAVPGESGRNCKAVRTLAIVAIRAVVSKFDACILYLNLAVEV